MELLRYRNIIDMFRRFLICFRFIKIVVVNVERHDWKRGLCCNPHIIFVLVSIIIRFLLFLHKLFEGYLFFLSG